MMVMISDVLGFFSYLMQRDYGGQSLTAFVLLGFFSLLRFLLVKGWRT